MFNDKTIPIVMVCRECSKSFSFTGVSYMQILRYRDGTELIQDVFPDLSPEMRESIKLNTCPDCVEEMYLLMEESEPKDVYDEYDWE